LGFGDPRRHVGLYVAVEFGMQTMHDRSLDWMNRGHHHDAMIDAVARCRALLTNRSAADHCNNQQPPALPGVLQDRSVRDASPYYKPPAEPGATRLNTGATTDDAAVAHAPFEIGAHVILGLPGESHEDMMATARELGRLGVDAVKIHNLYCVKNTPLADQVALGEVRLMERAEYVRRLVDFIELLPERMIVDRISGDAPPDYFVGPSWCLDKPAVRTAVLAEFARRGTRQGARAESG
jgi:radical SAM superfamily enzyme